MNADSIRELVGRLKSEDANQRRAAAEKLCELRRKARPAVPALIHALSDPDADVRSWAVSTLGLIGSEAEGAVPQLISILQDDEEIVGILGSMWTVAARALARIGSPTALSVLLKTLDHPDPIVRRNVVHALEQAGPLKDVMIALVKRLADSDVMVREFAESTLADFGADPIPFLRECLKSKDPLTRVHGSSALLRISNSDVEAIDVATRDLTHPDDEVRRGAVCALWHAGKFAVLGLEALIEALRDPHPSVRDFAISAIQDIGPAAAKAIPGLVSRLTDEDQEVQSGAALALASLGKHSRSVLPALIGALAHENEDVRFWVADALGKIGPAAKSATPSLKRLTRDSSKLVRTSATVALKKIQKKRRRDNAD